MEWIIPTLLYGTVAPVDETSDLAWGVSNCWQRNIEVYFLFQVRAVRADPAGGGVPGRDGGLRSVQGSHPIAGLTGIPTLTNQILAPLQWLLTSLYSTNLILAPLQWLLTSLYLQPSRYSPPCGGCWRHSIINQSDARPGCWRHISFHLSETRLMPTSIRNLYPKLSPLIFL